MTDNAKKAKEAMAEGIEKANDIETNLMSLICSYNDRDDAYFVREILNAAHEVKKCLRLVEYYGRSES